MTNDKKTNKRGELVEITDAEAKFLKSLLENSLDKVLTSDKDKATLQAIIYKLEKGMLAQ